MSVAAQLVPTLHHLGDAVRITLGDLSRAEARGADTRAVKRVKESRQSIHDPAILCREIRWAVRLDVNPD